jgi:N-acetylmuramoyl-L-alanine amidase
MGVPADPNAPVTGVIRAYRPMARIDYLAVHCSATNPRMDIGRVEINRWHIQRGFDCIGYHYVIRRDGRVEKGRPDDRPGAHEPSINSRSISICLVGGVDASKQMKPENNFTPAQMAALRGLLVRLKSLHSKAEVIGHRDAPSRPAKACPSFDMPAQWKEWNT